MCAQFIHICATSLHDTPSVPPSPISGLCAGKAYGKTAPCLYSVGLTAIPDHLFRGSYPDTTERPDLNRHVRIIRICFALIRYIYAYSLPLRYVPCSTAELTEGLEPSTFGMTGFEPVCPALDAYSYRRYLSLRSHSVSVPLRPRSWFETAAHCCGSYSAYVYR